MNLRVTFIAVGSILVAAILAVMGAWWSALAIESRSAAAVNSKLLGEGITWTSVEANGLQVRLIGTAPNEAARFRAVNLVGSVIQSARIRDELEVTPVRAIEAPRFSVELLRNDDGISVIGLVPGKSVEATLTDKVAALAAGGNVSDMLETADYPAPAGWQGALEYGLVALGLLPRSKISIAADQISITAISTSAEEKRRLETELARKAPQGLKLNIEISAPRPVLTPFTLRFVRDQNGARFDACSADTEKSRDRILAAGTAAGIQGKTLCTIGLGVPTPRWADAAEAGIRAVAALDKATITFSDADVSLLAASEVSQAVFDRVVGDLQAQLPEVFSLQATLTPKETPDLQGPAEFTAILDNNGQVTLRGRLTDEVLRTAVDSFAQAQFGARNVYTATRLDADLPSGWPVRVLAGIEAMGLLHSGDLKVQADLVEISGVTGQPDGRARISQILSGKLGQGQTFRVNVTYDEQFDPLAALPTPEECAKDVATILGRRQITFSPGSAEIDNDSRSVIDALTKVLENCPAMQMEIAGYTDSQGSEGGNRALSQARAEAVLTALQGRRVDVSAFTAKGYGEERPIADNATEEGREANRRIEFTLLGVTTADAAEAPAGTNSEAVAGAANKGEETAAGGDDRLALATVDPLNGALRSITLPDEVFVFETTDETYPRPRRRPQ